MKIIIVSPKNRTVYNFRGDLIEEIKKKGHHVIVTGPDQTDIEKILNLKVQFVEIPFNKKSFNVFGDIKYFFKLIKLFLKEKPDVTLSYTIKPVIYGSIAARMAGVKNINSMITGGGYLFVSSSLKSKIIKIPAKMFYRLACWSSKNIIFQNKDDLKEFVDLRIVKKEKCKLVNGSGVNMKKFTPSPFPEVVTFFMLSRIIEGKGIKEYLEAAKVIKKEYPNTRFMLLGGVEKSTDSLGYNFLKPYIDAKIIDYYQETDNVKEFYEQCSVYVLPSYREGTPRTVLEAMAMARPVITTDVPGCRETVVNNKNGFLIPAKKSNPLVEKMKYYIKNQNRIKEMGIESYNICLEKFDVDKVNKQMLDHMGI